MIIATNHHGDDLYYFDEKTKCNNFFLRQIISSCNFETGNDYIDYFYGGLNYQIEHHLYPELSVDQYRFMQPKVKAVCQKYGVPYVQENYLIRNYKTFMIFIGAHKMKYFA